VSITRVGKASGSGLQVIERKALLARCGRRSSASTDDSQTLPLTARKASWKVTTAAAYGRAVLCITKRQSA
jgi:hypothetical protein